jgi:hypothetical protein
LDWDWSLEVADCVLADAELSGLVVPELDDEDGRLLSAAAPGRLDPLEAAFDSWYCFRAARVFGPMTPSIGPGSKPASFSICCCWRTSSLPALALACEDAPGFEVADCDEAPWFEAADCDDAPELEAPWVLEGWLALVLSDEEGVEDWA